MKLKRSILLLFGFLIAQFSSLTSISALDSFLMTPDGVRLFYEHVPVQSDKGTIIFLHGWGMSYNEWSGFKEKFQENGWSTMAFDFRGHGASIEAHDRQLDYSEMSSPRDRKRFFIDIRMAVDYLLTDKPIILIGSSVGANYALRYASEDGRINAVVLLAPGYDNFQILEKNTIENYGDRPIMLIAARNNPWSFRTCLDLKERAVGPSVFLGVQSSHEMNGFKDKMPFVEVVINWLNQTIVEHKLFNFDSELIPSSAEISIKEVL